MVPRFQLELLKLNLGRPHVALGASVSTPGGSRSGGDDDDDDAPCCLGLVVMTMTMIRQAALAGRQKTVQIYLAFLVPKTGPRIAEEAALVPKDADLCICFWGSIFEPPFEHPSEGL